MSKNILLTASLVLFVLFIGAIWFSCWWLNGGKHEWAMLPTFISLSTLFLSSSACFCFWVDKK